MSNLFIGFPVPRARIADMIEGSAPPKEHAANHEPNGSDPIVLPGDIDDNQIVKWNGTKFVGIDAPAGGNVLSPISVHPTAFGPVNDGVNFTRDASYLKKRTSFDGANFYAPVFFPDGVTVTKLTLYGERWHAGATFTLYLYQVDSTGNNLTMANITAGWTDGAGSGEDSSIAYAAIDISLYSYCLMCYIACDSNYYDAQLTRAKIDFT